jgi:hypothetical protein
VSELVGVADEPDRRYPVIGVEVERDDTVRGAGGGDQQAGLAVDEHRVEGRIRQRVAEDDASEPAGDMAGAMERAQGRADLSPAVAKLPAIRS